ncbi:hypothetical protein LL912_06120 [Niabella sp. CC-SYL272]|uniref:hypothetical protein n=1 Tax=Niabella agricola TaxID=2891571 RepID=UPI001F321400|nr:hypothetical protein [Niabella agricola]MCF3108348.1 hypothetical protein [Niabella agricola]
MQRLAVFFLLGAFLMAVPAFGRLVNPDLAMVCRVFFFVLFFGVIVVLFIPPQKNP